MLPNAGVAVAAPNAGTLAVAVVPKPVVGGLAPKDVDPKAGVAGCCCVGGKRKGRERNREKGVLSCSSSFA